MLKRMCHKAVLTAAFLALSVGFAAPDAWCFVADGLLDDWGVSPGPYSAGPSQWTPTAPGAYFVQEDNNPAVDFLGPGWGGQQYDVEAVYFAQDGDNAYFAVVTGFPLRTVGGNKPGDFALDFNSDGTYEFGVETRGTHYLYGDVEWKDPDLFPEAGPFAIKDGDVVGLVGFGYRYAGNGHYVFEMGIPTSYFGSYWGEYRPSFTAHWTMQCGNDVLDLKVPSQPVPEPSTMLLLGSGLLGLAVRRRFTPRV